MERHKAEISDQKDILLLEHKLLCSTVLSEAEDDELDLQISKSHQVILQMYLKGQTSNTFLEETQVVPSENLEMIENSLTQLVYRSELTLQSNLTIF